MGTGILLVHHISVISMEEAIVIHYASFSFVSSIVISLLFSYLGIYFFFQKRQVHRISPMRNVFSSIVLGLTISLMHFSGMNAVTFSNSHQNAFNNGFNSFALAIVISLFAFVIMIFTIFYSFFDYHKITSEKRLLQQIRDSEDRYRQLVEHSPDPILVHDGQKIIFVNDVCLEMVHASDKRELVGKRIKNFIPLEYKEMMKDGLEKIKAGKKVKPAEIQIFTLDGSLIDVEVNGVKILYDRKASIQLIIREITEKKKIQRKIMENEQRYQSLFKYNPDGVFSLDAKGVITDVNPFVEKLLGYSKEEILGMPYEHVLDDKSLDIANKSFNEALSGKPQSIELMVTHKNGHKIPIYITDIPIIIDKKIIGVHGIAKDISKEKEAQRKITELAYQDQLTQLPNRTCFYKEIGKVMKRAQEMNNKVALLVVDFDNFKNVNDTLGHMKGDLFLKKIAYRMKGAIRKKDNIFRMGGDEFIIVLENVTVDEAREVAERLLKEMNQPVPLIEHEIVVTLSIGISMYNAATENVEKLLQQADFAMYSAKEEGKNNYRFFTKDLNEKVKRKHHIERGLRRAIERKEFKLYYQPKVELHSGKMVGLEALLRWNPSFGSVSPNEFIPIAEETGLIVPIGEWVLKEACRQSFKWKQHGFPKMRVSVNVSARQFKEPEFMKRIVNILEETEMDPHYLEMEITESVMLDAQDSLQIVKELKDLGIKIAIDDFGTGYSSMKVISSIEFDTLKIDKSLIADVENHRSMSVLKTIIGITEMVENIQIVMEGVETEEQIHFLKQFNLVVQGYYYSQPLPSEQLEIFWNQTLQLDPK